MKKKRSIITVNLSSKARFCLENAGFIDRNMKSKGHTSSFISTLIIDHFELGRCPDRARVMMKSLKKQLVEKQKARDILETDMQGICQEIQKFKELMK